MRQYDRNDYYEIVRWLEMRGLPAPKQNDFPMYGLFVPNTAAGFLVITDSMFALLDFFITNPEQSALKRGRALNGIIDGLITRAKNLGFSHIKCDTQIDTIKRKARSLGFQDLGPYQVFLKGI